MSVTLVQTASDFTSGFSASKAPAFGSNNTAGNSIIVVVAISGQIGRHVTAISDSANGSVYSLVCQAGASGSQIAAVYRADSIAGAANTVTVTLNGTESWAIACYEVTPIGTVDQTKTATGTSATPSSGSGTTGFNGEFCVGGIGYLGSASFAAGTGWTATGDDVFGGAIEQQIQASAGAIQADGTLGSSVAWAAALATFPASGAPPATVQAVVVFIITD